MCEREGILVTDDTRIIGKQRSNVRYIMDDAESALSVSDREKINDAESTWQYKTYLTFAMQKETALTKACTVVSDHELAA